MQRLWFLAAILLTSSAWAEDALTLERAVQLALERNERSLIATQRVEAAEARVFKARSFFFPDVAVSATYTRQPERLPFRPADSLIGVASLQMTLFDGRSFPLYRMAAREAEATAFEAVNTKRLVAFEAADAFLQTLSAQQVAEAAVQRRELAARALEETTVRQKAGLVSSNDATRAQLELADATQAATRAQNTAQLSAIQLAYLLDAKFDRLELASDVVPESAAPAENEEVLVARALEERADLAAAALRVEAAEAYAQEPLWRWVPSLGLGAQYSLRNTETALSGNQDWNASVSLSWVLFDGFERVADRQERLALANIASLSREATRRSIALEVQAALVALANANAAVKQAEVAATVARQYAEETGVLYGQGLARAFEVADANVQRFEAEVTLARGRYARALAWLDLRAAVGQDPLGREMQR